MRRALCACCYLGLIVLLFGAAADTVQADGRAQLAPLTFSNLIMRIDGEDSIQIGRADVRVLILEQLRAAGFKAVGAENLVFEIDKSGDAEYALGGTVREVECLRQAAILQACSVAIDWELMHLASEQLVYRVKTRAAVHGLQGKSDEQISKQLVLAALGRLTVRGAFVAALRQRGPAASATFEDASLRTCASPAQPLPQYAERALDATVIIADGRGHGSGFFVNEAGLILTAAHVVKASELEVRTRRGEVYRAKPVRVSRRHDVALLRLVERTGPDTPVPCLPLDLGKKAAGIELYAVGAPASKQLAFSITRGIMSGLRDFDGVQFIQTDASISPGNSGGPLIESDGRVAAVVSWKVMGGAIEGIAFGAPIDTALTALGLTPGSADAPALAVINTSVEPPVRVFDDGEDPRASLDPEGDRLRARAAEQLRTQQEAARRAQADEQRLRQQESEREARLDALTPGYVAPLRWGGVALAGAGAIAIALTAARFDESSVTRDEFETLRLWNDIGWAALGTGAAAFAVSWIVQPALPEADDTRSRETALRVGVGPGGLMLAGSY